RRREAEHRPELRRPWTRREHDLLADLDRALGGDDVADGPVGTRLEAEHLDAPDDPHAFGLALRGETLYRRHVEGEPALVLVQAHRDALCAPVREERAHVAVDLGGADDELGAVADPLLALVGRD